MESNSFDKIKAPVPSKKQEGVSNDERKYRLMNFYTLHASVFVLDLVFTIAIGYVLYRFMPHVFYILTGKRKTKG